MIRFFFFACTRHKSCTLFTSVCAATGEKRKKKCCKNLKLEGFSMFEGGFFVADLCVGIQELINKLDPMETRN